MKTLFEETSHPNNKAKSMGDFNFCWAELIIIFTQWKQAAEC